MLVNRIGLSSPALLQEELSIIVELQMWFLLTVPGGRCLASCPTR